MSDIQINICSSGDTSLRRVTAGNKRKKKRLLQRMQYCDNKCKFNHRRGQSGLHHPPSQLNRVSVNHPSHPTSAQNQSLPLTGRAAASSSCSSKPAASTLSLPSLTVTVTNKGCHETPKEPVDQESSSTLASCAVAGSHQPSGQTPAGFPTKFLAIDCEMVGTGPKGRISQLARCSIVSYEGDVVYDKFINPSVPVTDYRTRWSGIRHRDLVKATPYSEARKEILRLLMGKVVIGHAIHNDFKVLGYSHPTALTRDTSRIPLLNRKAGFAENECASLKRLTKAIFNRDIQTGKKGHSSVEDAKATMELYRVVEDEWEKTLASK
ncbi:interferon-stimulated 20 kDa exonuclease-like 2 [Aulostomus maculatus]